MKAKSMTVMILFLSLSLALSGIVSAQATPQVTKITANTYEDSFPRTAGGYVVWQALIDGDWEIFLYNANDNTGPFQITDNAYDDIAPRTDGKYVTWAAGSAPFGEIFLYDISTSITTQITSNNDLDVNPTVFSGKVVWASKSVLDIGLAPGDIFLYDGYTTINVSRLVDPNNDYDDYSFRFDGQQILWDQNTTPLDDKNEASIITYLYDLATGSIYRYYTPEIGEPYLKDITTGVIEYKPEGLTLHDSQADGDYRVTIRSAKGVDREIELIKGQRGDLITANDIEDGQPTIGDYIVAWKGDTGNNAEIYIHEILPYLRLLSPGDGKDSRIKELFGATFVWKSSYIKYKIQFSNVASFEGPDTLTFPEETSTWLNEPSITFDRKGTADRKITAKLIMLSQKYQKLYWRVLAQDGYGNEIISKARRITVSH